MPGNERCYYCLESVERKQLKRCARCTYVKYCSKECQIKSWKSGHKNTCTPRKILTGLDEDSTPEDKYHYDQEKALSKWLAAWTGVFEQYTCLALDLANNPRDRHKTHCMLMLVRRTESKVDACSFEVLDVTIESCARLLGDFPQLNSVLADPPEMTDERARYVVMVEDPLDPDNIERVRCRVWCDRGLHRYRPASARDKATFKLIADAIPDEVIAEVDMGDPDATRGRLGVER